MEDRLGLAMFNSHTKFEVSAVFCNNVSTKLCRYQNIYLSSSAVADDG